MCATTYIGYACVCICVCMSLGEESTILSRCVYACVCILYQYVNLGSDQTWWASNRIRIAARLGFAYLHQIKWQSWCASNRVMFVGVHQIESC